MKHWIVSIVLVSSFFVMPDSAWSRRAPYRSSILVQQLQQAPVQALKSPQTLLSELERANGLPNNLVQRVQIVSSNTLNASTDGQTITVTSALWNSLKTNDERAFVISHELSHVVLHHLQTTQLRRIGLSALDKYLLSRFYKPGSVLEIAEGIGLNLVDKRFSRDVEYQADDLGLQLLSKTGYNPKAAIDVFTVLQQNNASLQLPEFLQDHPMSESRIRTLVQKYQLQR